MATPYVENILMILQIASRIGNLLLAMILLASSSQVIHRKISDKSESIEDSLFSSKIMIFYTKPIYSLSLFLLWVLLFFLPIFIVPDQFRFELGQSLLIGWLWISFPIIPGFLVGIALLVSYSKRMNGTGTPINDTEQ